MDELRPAGPTMVVAPHPDDESLGCGGLLADIWQGGGLAHVLCLTDGAASHPNSRSHPPRELRAVREAELRRAVNILGGGDSDVTALGLPDAALHRVHGPGQDLARAIGAALDRLQPDLLLVPSPLDPHCDHQAAAAAARVAAATRPQARLVHYPVWSAWIAPRGLAPEPPGTRRFRRDHGHRRRKRAAIEAHESQRGLVVRDDPAGFAMPPGFAWHFVHHPETFFGAAP